MSKDDLIDRLEAELTLVDVHRPNAIAGVLRRSISALLAQKEEIEDLKRQVLEWSARWDEEDGRRIDAEIDLSEAREEIERLKSAYDVLRDDCSQLRDENDRLTAQLEEARRALDEAEACMSIVEPRGNKAEYIRILGVVRNAFSLKETTHEQA